MAAHVALISCGKEKLKGIHAARDMYTSPRFKMSLQAGRCFDSTFILSAYYGLLKPTNSIATYDMTFENMFADERRAWARRVIRQVRRHIPRGSRLYFLCPKPYREPLAELLRLDGYACVETFKGLNRGKQMSWLKKAVERARWLNEETSVCQAGV